MDLPEKFYVQYAPDPAALAYLTSLQHDIAKNKLAGRPVAPQKLHLTILHFGALDDTFQQLKNIQTELTRSTYTTAFKQFASGVDDLRLPNVSLQPSSLTVFGTSTLVVTFAASDELMRIHRQVMQLLEQFCKQYRHSD